MRKAFEKYLECGIFAHGFARARCGDCGHYFLVASVCIAAYDRAGLERLLRYCARAPFESERLRKANSELVYRCAKQHSEPGGNPHNKRARWTRSRSHRWS